MRGGAMSFGVASLTLSMYLEPIGSNDFDRFGMNGF